MARQYTEVALVSGRPFNESIIEAHFITGYGGPVHLIVSADDQQMVDRLTAKLAELLKQEVVLSVEAPSEPREGA